MRRTSLLCLLSMVFVIPSVPARAETHGTIAFSRSMGRFGNLPSEIFAIGPGKRHHRRLTHNDVPESGPIFSPGGGRMAFGVGGDTYDRSIWVMRSDGTHRHLVVDLRGGNGIGDWSPDGKLIVFERIRFHRPAGDIHTVHPDGTGLRRVIRTRADESYPRWSPDGDRIAVISTRKTGLSDIWTMDLTGHRWQRVTRGVTVCTGRCEDRYGGIDGLDWAPDGDRLVFAAHAGDGVPEIWIVGENGRGLRKLTEGEDPAWFSGSNRIVYSYDGAIYKIRPNGSDRVRLTRKRRDRAPSWGPLEPTDPARGP